MYRLRPVHLTSLLKLYHRDQTDVWQYRYDLINRSNTISVAPTASQYSLLYYLTDIGTIPPGIRDIALTEEPPLWTDFTFSLSKKPAQEPFPQVPPLFWTHFSVPHSRLLSHL